MKKKLLAWVMTLTMLLSLVPGLGISAGAEEATPDTSWYTNHVSETSFTLYDVDDLEGLAAIVNGTASGITTDTFANKTITLDANFDNSGSLTTPIGTDSDHYFKGIFDGNKQTVTLAIGTDSNPYNGTYAGLFGYVYNGTVKNVSTTGSIYATSTSNCYAGGVVGYANEKTTIQNCHSTAEVTVTTTESNVCAYAGGVVGQSNLGSLVTDCSATGNVTATSGTENSTTAYAYAGGVVGNNTSKTVNCYYTTGTVTAGGKSGSVAGGVVGNNSGIIANCYATATGTGTVTAINETSFAGGVAGRNNKTITNCYAAVTVSGNKEGGVASYNNGTITNCYCLKQNGLAVCNNDSRGTASCAALTDAQMKGASGDGLSLVEALNLYVAANSGEGYSSWTATSDSYPTFGNGQVASGPYTINNVSELEILATLVNSGVTFSEKTVKLADSFQMGENEALTTPIGTDRNRFKGTFDGNGKTVTLDMANSTAKYAGLFGYVENGTVKNVSTTGIISATNTAGGVVGYMFNQNGNASVTNCSTTAAVTATSNAGGVVGYVNNYGGIASVTNCYATGAVTATSNAGGVVGYVMFITNEAISVTTSVTNCYAIGKVEATGNYSNAGGVIGYVNKGTNPASVTNCYATGVVSGDNATKGGVVGGNYNGTITNCYYKSDSATYGVGCAGLDTTTDGNKATNCAGTTALTADQMQSDSTTGLTLVDALNLYVSEHRDSGYSYWQAASGAYPVFNTAKSFTADSPYTINNVDELELLAAFVNSGVTFSGQTVKLAGSFQMGENEALTTPIGKGEKAFSGTFDGNGKNVVLAISGAYQNAGLFGNVFNGTIQNVSTSGEVTATYNGDCYVGGVVGFSSGGSDYKVINCNSSATVSATGTSSEPSSVTYAGGVVGENADCTTANCYATGKVTASAKDSASSYAGGVAGRNDGSITNCYAIGEVNASGGTTNTKGGVVGNNINTITNCYYLSGIAEKGVGYSSNTTISATALPEAQMKAGAGEKDGNGWATLGDYGTVSLVDALNAYVTTNSDKNYSAWTVESSENNGYPVFGSAESEDNNNNNNSGGGSSSSTVSVPVSGDKDAVQVKATVSNGNATLKNITSDQIEAVDTEDPVTVDLSGLKKTVTSVTLPTTTFENVADSAAAGLTVKLSGGTEASFDKAAVSAITEQAQGKTIQLVMTTGAKAEKTMTAAQKETVKTMKNPLVLDTYLVSNNIRISDFAGGMETLTVSYVTTAPVQGWYLAEDGSTEIVSTSSDGQTANITVGHNSHYVIAEVEESEDDPTTDPVSTTCPKDDTCVYAKFTDAETTAWYHDGVHFCVEQGYMNGVSDTKFAPSATLSRGMIVTMLNRMEGTPVANYAMSFADVENDKWYTEAIRWAQSTGLVSGYDEDTFGPNDSLTREQLATILYRLAESKGEGFVGASAFYFNPVDGADISDWASEAMRWCYMKGILTGDETGALNPTGNATRAEAATMLQRFCEAMET